MRTHLVHPGADQLTYEIRGIIEVAQAFAKLGVPIIWENIGDPIAKGEQVPQWVRDIIANEVRGSDVSFGYSPTRGMLFAREYLVSERNVRGKTQITVDDILFFNGLGDAIATLYANLDPRARIIGPTPAYPTHSSAEGAHADAPHLTYTLDPKHGWLPDLEDLRNKIKYNPSIAGIIIINPDNPTGTVYPRAVLEGMVALAKEFGLFIISDEIYGGLVYGDTLFTPLADVLDGVPGIAMRGLSKEVPWPGSRCGWIEVYNSTTDPLFARYVRSLLDAKMLQVCATTLPQVVLPKILGHESFGAQLKTRADGYLRKAKVAEEAFATIPGVIAPRPGGAFYYSVVFGDGVLTDTQSVELSDSSVGAELRRRVKDVAPDKRFAYSLLASTGICVVPLSGFQSSLHGFRMTLLESDEEKFSDIVSRIATFIRVYTSS